MSRGLGLWAPGLAPVPIGVCDPSSLDSIGGQHVQQLEHGWIVPAAGSPHLGLVDGVEQGQDEAGHPRPRIIVTVVHGCYCTPFVALFAGWQTHHWPLILLMFFAVVRTLSTVSSRLDRSSSPLK